LAMSATTRRSLPAFVGASERTRGALLSSDDYGSSVERAAKLHPLWQEPVAAGVLRATALRFCWGWLALLPWVMVNHRLLCLGILG
jgi:hypothetical protein